MKLEFTYGRKGTVSEWCNMNAKLESDLRELVSGHVPELELKAYLDAMISELRPVENSRCRDMLFLMYDNPACMDADARVDFVYTPTYIAATIMMTASCRYNSICEDEPFRNMESSEGITLRCIM